MNARFHCAGDVFICCPLCPPNNNYTNFSFLGFLKEYSIVGIFLKEKFVIKIKMSDESLLGFYYHEMPNWHNIGNLSLLIFESTEHPSERYSPRVVQEVTLEEE